MPTPLFFHKVELILLFALFLPLTALAQVERGMAWVYPKYNKDKTLPKLQERARSEMRGLWSDPDPVKPWAWRKQRSKK